MQDNYISIKDNYNKNFIACWHFFSHMKMYCWHSLVYFVAVVV